MQNLSIQSSLSYNTRTSYNILKNKISYSIYITFDEHQNIILQYLTFFIAQVIFISHISYLEYLLLDVRLNSYKVGIVFLPTR